MTKGPESGDAEVAQGAEQHGFQADVSRLLHMMVHSMYSDREIFLREIVSNAADACEKLRYEAISRPELLDVDATFAIRVKADKEAGTLEVHDNGVGMSRSDLIEALGTIANSGTRAFLDQMAPPPGNEDREIEGGAGDSKLIGQFGIGFYSAFMVADRVDVHTRRAGTAEAWRWSSDGKGSYSIQPDAPDEAPTRGTRVVLHLKSDAREFLDTWRLRNALEVHSGAIAVPIVLELPDGEGPKTISEGRALWTRPRTEISETEYAEFYRSLAHQIDEPAMTLHWRAEGRYEYTVLAFVPGSKPVDLFDPSRRGSAKLYVRRVLIDPDFELLPAWLRFVRLVVDCADLPLNASRELIQKTPMLTAIRKAVVTRVLQEITRLAESDAGAFARLWENFGATLKEGLYDEPERRDQLLKIARFRTAAGGETYKSLDDYVQALRPNQTAIYYLVGESAEQLKISPQLEAFRARGIDVLLLSDPIDAFWVATSVGYDGKPFRSVTQGDLDIASIEPVDADAVSKTEDITADMAMLIARMKQSLQGKVADVRASTRLAQSPACLVAAEAGPDLHLGRMLAAHNRAPEAAPAVLEVNASHALMRLLASKVADPAAEELLEDAAWLLLEEARLLEGERPTDAAAFAQRLFRVLAKAAT